MKPTNTSLSAGIITGYINDNSVPVCDEVWVITRVQPRYISNKYSYPIKWVPELSPSTDLFADYRTWAKTGQWSKNKFDTEYRPRFLKEMRTQKTSYNKLIELYELSKVKKILLLCYCKDENTCHRLIVKELINIIGTFHLIVNCNHSFKDYNIFKSKIDSLLINKKPSVQIISLGTISDMARKYAEENGYTLVVTEDNEQAFGNKNAPEYTRNVYNYVAQFYNKGCVFFTDNNTSWVSNNIQLCNAFGIPYRTIVI